MPLCAYVNIIWAREAERQTDRETERKRDRETERQRDRETELMILYLQN